MYIYIIYCGVYLTYISTYRTYLFTHTHTLGLASNVRRYIYIITINDSIVTPVL